MNVFNSKYRYFAVAVAAAGLMGGSSEAATVSRLNAANDVLIYAGVPELNFNGTGWNTLLSAGATSSGHDTQTLIRFDLTGLSLAENEKATLNLYVVDTASARFGVSPTEANPVTTQARQVTGADWQESTVNWVSRPATGDVVGSTKLTGINRWVSIDISEAVRDWLATEEPAPNYGLLLTQAAPVTNGGSVMGVFASRETSNQPYLQISTVPEPASLAAIVGIGATLVLGRRRRA